MNMPLLSIQDLHVSFKVQSYILHAVRGISFTLDDSEILGIVGESGCGKSATAKAIVKLLPSYSASISGQILYKGQDLLGFNETKMQKIRGKEIGMIFQDSMTSLNPTMKIGDQIAEGYLHHHKEANLKNARDYAIQLLELVGIPHPAACVHDYPHVLSGGMRQRAMIAIALAPKPKVIIADEPTTALDVTIQAQILDLMYEIKEKTGTSFILITHDMSVVAGYCDRVLVMYSGKVVENASVNHLFSNPSHPYTQGLLQSIPRLDMPTDQPLIPIEGAPPNLMQEISGCAFYNRCKEAMAICKEKDPLLKQINSDHKTACWKRELDETSS